MAVFCRNTTDAINHLSYRLQLAPDDVVVTTVAEHHAILDRNRRGLGQWARRHLAADPHGHGPHGDESSPPDETARGSRDLHTSVGSRDLPLTVTVNWDADGNEYLLRLRGLTRTTDSTGTTDSTHVTDPSHATDEADALCATDATTSRVAHR